MSAALRLRVALRRCVALLALILAAPGSAQDAAPGFGFVGLHGGVFDVLTEFASAAGVRVAYLPDDELAAGSVDLAQFDAVLLQHVRGDVRRALPRAVAAARARRPALRVLVLSGNAPQFDGEGGEPGFQPERDTDLQAYYGTQRENLRRMLGYLRVRIAGRGGEVEPPRLSAALGAWHPAHPELMDRDEFEAWLAARGGDFAARPRVAVAAHSIHLEFQQPAVIRALVEKLEARGCTAFAVVDAAEGLQGLRDRYERLLQDLHPDAVVHTCHSTDRLEFRLALDVPHTTSLFFRKQSIADWATSAKGLDAGEVVFQIATQELLGAIEPIAAAGTRLGGGSAEAFVPVDERMDHLVARTLRWVELRRKANAAKRIALVYWDRGMDKADLMRGSATGMHMNAPQSLLAVIARMQADGYTLRDVPQDEDELLRRMLRGGRQVPMHDRDELAALVRDGDPVLLPVRRYVEWLERRVPAKARAELEARWGPPPGRIMTATDAAGEPCFVIPRLDLGGLVLLPQPLRGEAHDNAAIHDKLTCPPHHYVATYLWLEEQLHADAVVHFGTHGSEFQLPGKDVGLGPDDWPDIVLGTLPNIAPWIVENLGEAMVVKRRTNAVLIGHLPPPAVDGGLADGLLRLHDDLERWKAVDAGGLEQRFRLQISKAIVTERLDVDLHLEPRADGTFDAAALRRVDDHLHRLAEETTPVSLHVFGERPSDDLLVPHLVSCLGKRFRQALAVLGAGGGKLEHARPAAERLLRALLVDGANVGAAFAAAGLTAPAPLPEDLARGLQQARALWDGYGGTHAELDNLMRALAGRFVAPGPGSGPMRNPAVLPSGRNLYALNPNAVPAQASWELGKQLAERLLQDQLAKHGRVPAKVAFSLSSFATFQDFGVMESQILWLLGCEPIWDERGLVRDVRVVPRAELGRPRVDVFLSALSYYRDNLPSRMELLDRAVRAVADRDEADNQVAAATRAAEATLIAAGTAPAQAHQLARARVFGYAPGTASSASYYYLVERSGDWDTREDLMAIYLDKASHVYTEGIWGEPARAAYEAAMQGTDVVLRTWYDATTSPLANKYTWYTGGSLALAIETVTGRKPEYTLSDVRDPNEPRLVSSEDALRDELRVRLFNRKWIEGMKAEGYAGADQMKVMVSNVFGWQTVREGSIGQDVWQRIREVYLDDALGIGLREFFAAKNPFAEQEIAELMLEAARKGYWQADAAALRAVARRYLDSVAQHGSAGGLLEAGKGKVNAYAKAAAAAATAAEASNSPPTAAASTATTATTATNAGTAATEPVRGQRLEPVEAPVLARADVRPWLFAAAAVLLLLGILRRPSV